ncbi:hypothetical protein AAG570_010242 [Ranatra chinensis]|uniref:Serpin domain-containing protein n=1 Tax=Ranatra chinensis TaxID=642074 RepID=A0ABD0YM02_9HEMI
MASKRRNMSYENKKQEKTEIDTCNWPSFCACDSYLAVLQLGLEKIFKTNEADFSRASDAKNLEVNQVYHKAAIQVDEKGTVASAATAVDLVVRVAPIFQADRPFMFAIIDRPSSTVAFLGRYVKPTKGEN